MNKIVIVSKTHLDLGFTDYAENIRRKYLAEFVPSAIKIARAVNTDKKRFVWTTGSWLISEALKCGDSELKHEITLALKAGDIVAHALPFTTHTELLDADTLEYGLSLIDEIDDIRGQKTISAKMTDVPGHTAALVPFLAKKGIKLLHIGVNGASAVPDVPPCFLWRKDGFEIIVVYSGDYGGEFKSDYIDDILFFDHTLDNHGVRNPDAVIENYNYLLKKYEGYEVVAGSLDLIAEKLWAVKDKLPVITEEIGDSWIHGVASDPYKTAALRELYALKNEWLAKGALVKDSAEYKAFVNNLLLICEHTWGMDMKCYLGDYEHYLRKDFEKARAKDKVRIFHILRDYPHNLNNLAARLCKEYKKGRYSVIEESWREQRAYISKAILSLDESRAREARERITKLMPSSFAPLNGEPIIIGKEYTFEGYSLIINNFGGIGSLTLNGVTLINNNDKSALEYHSYGVKDYAFWFANYTRDAAKNKNWAFSDFGRPLLKYVDKEYRQGRFGYTLKNGAVQKNLNSLVLTAELTVDKYFSQNLGAPTEIRVQYELSATGLGISIGWLKKAANRLTESLHFNLFPNADTDNLIYKKLGYIINPYSIVRNGNRNLSAVENIQYNVGKIGVTVDNRHSPLVGLGKGKILQFDNVFEDVKKDGLSFILHNNVWGTNFPLWYEGSASFDFFIRAAETVKR